MTKYVKHWVHNKYYVEVETIDLFNSDLLRILKENSNEILLFKLVFV